MYNETFRAVDKDLIENIPESFKDKWTKAIADEDVLVGPKHFFVEPFLYDELIELFRNNEKDPYGIPNVCFSLAKPDDDRWEEWQYQRKSRGFDDTELWNLDSTIAKFITPRLKKFKKNTHSTPGVVVYEIGGEEAVLNSDSETSEKANAKWMEILDKMIWTFENWDKEPDTEGVHGEEFRKLIDEWNTKIKEGLDLFAKYFGSLWD